MKEFQPGLTNLTLWDDTYEKNLGQTSSSSSLMTPEPGGSRVKQLQAGQMGSVSPSKAAPLNISIPPGSSSPHKFLPSLHSGVDSSDFLKSLGVQERERRESEESTSTVTSQDNSFIKMLKQHPRAQAAQTNQTITGEVDMSQTMNVSMFQPGDLTDSELVEADSSNSKVDPGNFLANLASGKNKEDMMNTTNMSGRMDQTKVGGQMDMTCVGGRMNQTSAGGRMDLTCVGGQMDMTCGGGRMDLTCIGGRMDLTRAGGQMDMTCAGGQMDLTRAGVQMDLTCGEGRMDLTRVGGGLDITSAAPTLEKTRLGGQMDFTVRVNREEEEEPINPKASRTLQADVDMSQTMMDVSRFHHQDEINESVEVSPSTRQESEAETELTTRMELTRVAAGSMDFTTRGGLDMDLTRAGGRTNLTLTSGVPAVEKTRLGGLMELTRSVGSLATDGEADDDDMEMTAATPLQDSVFHPAPNPVIARMSKQPTVDELPGSESSSTNTSVECVGGATATVKFSGLSLANNTLILPRKESEEDELTKCPVQYFYYDSSKPVNNQPAAEASDPQSSEEVPVPPAGVESVGSVEPTPSSSICEGTEADWETLHSVVAPRLTPDLPSARRQEGQAGAEEESPEMTTCLGGLAMQAMQASRPQWDEEVTSFLPREESTRAVNLASLRAEAASVGVPVAEGDEESDLGGAAAEPITPVGETGEISRFSPFSSTRIDDDAAWPGSASPQQSAELLQSGRRSELVDITRIENQPGDSSLQPVVAETFVSGLEVTAAPGDCECHGKVAVREEHREDHHHHHHALGCSSKRQSDQFQPELASLQSPQKKLRLEESNAQQPESSHQDPEQHEDLATSDETIKAYQAETQAVSRAEDQDPTDQIIEVQSIQQSSENLTVDQVKTSKVKNRMENVPESVSVQNKEEDMNVDVEEDKSVSSSEQIPSEKPAEPAVRVEEELININDNQTGQPEPSLEEVPVETTAEIDSDERVENVPMEVSEEDKVQSPQQSSIEILLRNASRGASSKSEGAKVFQEVSIFQDLQMRKDSSAGSQNDWELQFSSDQLAAFTWMEKSLLVVLHLGEKLPPKKNRKSVGRVVHHWTISKIEFQSCHRDSGSLENIEQQISEAGKLYFLSLQLYISLNFSSVLCVEKVPRLQPVLPVPQHLQSQCLPQKRLHLCGARHNLHQSLEDGQSEVLPV